MLFAHSNTSGVGRSGSQTGNQRPQPPSDTRLQPARIRAAGWLVELHQATHRDALTVPSKQRVAGSNPAGRTRSEAVFSSNAQRWGPNCDDLRLPYGHDPHKADPARLSRMKLACMARGHADQERRHHLPGCASGTARAARARSEQAVPDPHARSCQAQNSRVVGGQNPMAGPFRANCRPRVAPDAAVASLERTRTRGGCGSCG
jgi:hypothetical protein